MSEANNIKISIILPTFNGAKFLRTAITSCLSQTHDNLELIVVDDGSTDQTPQIVASFKDPRIKCIRHTTNQGLPQSLNAGFAVSTGEYLTWTSDDNEYLPTTLEELLGFLLRNPQIDFVYSDMIVRNLDTGQTELRLLTDLNLENENNIGACFLYRRKVYQTIGEFNPCYQLVEDYDYWLRVAHHFEIRHFPKPLYIYGDHANSLTTTKRFHVSLMRDILRYRNGYLKVNSLIESIRIFAVNVEKIATSGRDQRMVWADTFSKMFRLSWFFGCFFTGLFILLLVKRLIQQAIKPLVKLLEKPAKEMLISSVVRRLRFHPGTNVLCMIPSMAVGGSEKVLWDIARGLQKYQYNFHLIGMANESNEWCKKFSSCFQNVVLTDKSVDDVYYQRYVTEMIKRLNVNVVLICNAAAGYRSLPSLKSQFPDLKVIDILHSESWGGTMEDYIWAATYINRRVCISQHLKDFMLERYAAADIKSNLNGKLTVIHNGYDLYSLNSPGGAKHSFRAKYQIPARDHIISFVGRFSPEKRPLLFIEVARALIADQPDKSWKFVMAGDGPESIKIRQRIKKCGLEKSFILTGMLDDVSGLFAETFVLLIVSRKEGIPLVIQEAFAMGVPTISTNIGGIHELVENGLNGFLVEPDEHIVRNFLEKIKLLADNKTLYQTMKRQTRSSISPKFSFQHMTTRYHQVFDDVLHEQSDDAAKVTIPLN